MKTSVFCLLLAVTLSTQATPVDSAITRAKSILQRINLDTFNEPISMVIAVQTNDTASEAVAAIRQIGLMLEPLITGERGEIALLCYGDHVRTIQPFTSDSAVMFNAINGLKVDGTSSRLTDAVVEATSVLDTRPEYRRRIILVVGESGDHGSEGKVSDALARVQRSNVLIYVVAVPDAVHR
jgi:hypothetical protein